MIERAGVLWLVRFKSAATFQAGRLKAVDV
jgi:hypothetical protein